MMLTMLFALTLLAVEGQVAAEQPAKPSAQISGRVVAADTGRPIRWATVRMVSERGRQFATATDSQGRFTFDALPAGTYSLDAAAERYLRMYLGGQPYTGLSAVIPRRLTLKDGERFDKADFSLPYGGAIEGRLLDEFGEPAPGLVVQLSQLMYAGGRHRLMPTGPRPEPTDDRGHFRLHGLSPGTYYISALSGVFAEQAETGGFAPTYYPGTSDISGAQPIKLGLGQEITNLSFALTPARMARISGRVIDERGNPVRGTLSLHVADSTSLTDFFMARGTSNPDGSFVFRNVPPGNFTLQGFGSPPPGGPQNLGAAPFGWLPLTVSGNDQADVLLRAVFGPSLKGRITTEEAGGPPLNLVDVRVSTIPVQFDSAPVGGGPSPSQTNEDGSFEVKNQSGIRVVRVSVRNPAWMLERVTRNGQDITDQPIDFTKGAVGDVEVVLTSRVTAISGSVTDEAGNPVSDYSVIVFAADPSKWTDRSRFLALGRPGQDGRFTVRGLPPDDYLAIALPATQGSEWQDPELLKTLRERATGFLLGEGEQKTLTMRILK